MGRSWSKFTGSFKLSRLSQQLPSGLWILRWIKLQEFLAVKISRRLFGTLRPQSAEPAAAHLQHLGLCVRLTFPSQPSQAVSSSFWNKPPKRVRSTQDRLLPPRPPRPFCGHPQAALPQAGTSAWLPKAGEEMCGARRPSKQLFSRHSGRARQEGSRERC